jgi:hypothetical protein
VYELKGTTLLVVERDERVRSELVLDLYFHGARVIVAPALEEALEAMRVEHVDCVLASAEIASPLRERAQDEVAIAAIPIVATASAPSPQREAIEA